MTDKIEDGVPVDECIEIGVTSDFTVNMTFKNKDVSAEMSAGDAVRIGVALMEAGFTARALQGLPNQGENESVTKESSH